MLCKLILERLIAVKNIGGKKLFHKLHKHLNFWNLVVLIFLTLSAIFIIYPFGKMFLQSFTSSTEEGFTLSNYLTFFQKKYYYTALFNSMKICFVTTILATGLGVPLAYIGTRFNLYFKRTINIMIVLSMLSPPFIGAYSWITLLGRAGVITKLLA